MTSDSTARIDSACHPRYRLQKFGRALKTPPGVLLEEYLNENNDRLRDMFEFFER